MYVGARCSSIFKSLPSPAASLPMNPVAQAVDGKAAYGTRCRHAQALVGRPAVRHGPRRGISGVVARPDLLAVGKSILVKDPRAQLRPHGILRCELGGTHLEPGPSVVGVWVVQLPVVYRPVDAPREFVPIALASQALEACALVLGEDVAHVEARVLSYRQ